MKNITRELVKEMVAKLLKQEVKYGKYGNGNEAPYRRIVEDGTEFTLIGLATDAGGMYLYIGNEGATVTRLKEGRREDSLEINGERVEWAGLYANNIRNEKEMFFTF